MCLHSWRGRETEQDGVGVNSGLQCGGVGVNSAVGRSTVAVESLIFCLRRAHSHAQASATWEQFMYQSLPYMDIIPIIELRQASATWEQKERRGPIRSAVPFVEHGGVLAFRRSSQEHEPHTNRQSAVNPHWSHILQQFVGGLVGPEAVKRRRAREHFHAGLSLRREDRFQALRGST